MTGPDPRRLAAAAIRRVLEEDAYAAAVLSQAIEAHPQLAPRDRALVTELVYGTLRTFRWIEGRLQQLAARGIQHLDGETRAHLAVGAYQVCFLDKIPAHAAVDRAVTAIKEARGAGVAGFSNAVLRRMATERDPSLTPLEAALRGAPRWLVRSLDHALGAGKAADFLLAGPVPPPVGLRVRRGEIDAWLAAIRDGHPTADVSRGLAASRAIVVRHGGDPRKLPGVPSYDVVVQEEGSQVVAEAVDARPGDRVLDACAGRGNKTLALLDAVGSGGRVDAVDLHPAKLDRLVMQAASLGLASPRVFAVDWTRGRGDVEEDAYDRVLVDAPCSGTGTLRRRPEILLRRTKEDLASLATLQREILTRALRSAKRGGRVVYATCSVLAEELEDVVAGVPELRVLSVRRLLPNEHGTDGYGIVTAERSD